MHHNYFHTYFHEACLPECQRAQFQFSNGARNLNEELARHKTDARNEQQLLRSRQDLRGALRRLRTLFAQRLDCAPYLIFHDRTLNEIVVKLPRNKSTWMAVYGIGDQKFKSFGTPILSVVEQYSSRLCNTTRHKQEQARTSASSAPGRLAAEEQLQSNDNSNGRVLLKSRHGLRQRLRKLRSELAGQQNSELPLYSYIIFPNKTLDDIVIKLPTSRLELMNMYGIAAKKCDQFGEDILSTVREYNSLTSITCSKSQNSNRLPIIMPPAQVPRAVEEDDLAMPCETLSCEDIEDIVRMKFEDAVANGCMISLDC
jgi:superfamily II DNA helicase RecQ